MKTATQERYGPPAVLMFREVPKPVPGIGEVLVRVHAVSATLVDTACCKADPFITRSFTGLFAPKNLILGGDISGVVEALGEGVTRFSRGDAIYGATVNGSGGNAEYVVVPESAGLVGKPENLDHGAAAGLSYSFLTALPFIRDEARLQPGQTILINGASGSIGIVAVQLAKHFGAEVTAVCSGRNSDFVRSFGADRVIDYTCEDLAAATGAFDVIFDAVGKSSYDRCKAALKPNGIYLTTVPTLAIVMQMLRPSNRRGKRGKLATTGLRPIAEKAKDLLLLNEMVTAGTVRPAVDRRYPFERIVEAYEYVETERKRGDVVLEMDTARSR